MSSVVLASGAKQCPEEELDPPQELILGILVVFLKPLTKLLPVWLSVVQGGTFGIIRLGLPSFRA